jgi:hypothetical protein
MARVLTSLPSQLRELAWHRTSELCLDGTLEACLDWHSLKLMEPSALQARTIREVQASRPPAHKPMVFFEVLNTIQLSIGSDSELK